jgi:DNA-binding SARP family transcriptional activator
MAELERLGISLLGPLTVDTAGGVLSTSDFGGRKPRQVFERLALARNTAVSKDTLAAGLWPTKAPKHSDATLENYVSMLRKLLFSDREEACRVLATSDRGYWLRSTLVDLDLDRFEEWIERAESAMSLRRSLQCRLEAAAIPRGALVEGTIDDVWVGSERDRYSQLVVQNLMAITELQLKSADFAGALCHSEAVLKIEPYSEEAFRLLMLAHYAMGHETSARKTFERCRKLIQDEFQQDCTSGTESLAASMDAGESPAVLLGNVPSRLALRSRALVGRLGEIEYRSASERDETERRNINGLFGFVGRESELGTLEVVVERALAGELATALISGRRGMGKSALLHRVQLGYGSISGRVSYGEIDSGPERLPLSRAILEILQRRAVAEYTSGPFLKCDDQALTVLVEVLRDNGPLVFLLDDLHLAHHGTISSIAWLQANAPDIPVAIIATAECVPLPYPTDSGDGLEFDEVIHLDPLRAEEVASLGLEAEQLRVLCGGSPLLMADLWRWRVSGIEGLPPSLQETIKGQIRCLDPSLIEALEVLAQLPEPVAPTALKLELSAPMKRVKRTISQLSRENLVSSQSDGLRFTAPMVRRVVAGTILARQDQIGDDSRMAS